MNVSLARFFRFGVILAGLVVLGWVFTSRAAKPQRQGLPTDWTHSQVIFGKPASEEQERMVAQDPRYWQQRYRREIPRELPVQHSGDLPVQAAVQTGGAVGGGQWSEDLGASGTPLSINYPAKYSFNITTANCASTGNPDYVVYSTGLMGSPTQASVVAFDNLYSGCSGTVPGIYWAYNTGGLILTSPVLSLDGTQVAFVQTSGSPTGNAGLVLLKWKLSATESVGTPGVPTLVSASQYPTCFAPCMTEVFLHNGSGANVDDRTSSPFYDYSSDIVWVGGAGGWLHQITGAFKGTPTEVTSGGFPVQVNTSGNAISNPVYDHVSQNVFVGDEGAGGGYLYRVPAATGVPVASARMDFVTGFQQGPLLDQTNGLIYMFSSSDGTTNCTGGVACGAIYELGTSFAAGTSGQEVTIGVSSASANPVYLGAFDSEYLNTPGATGDLYVCGNPGASPIVYRTAILSGVMHVPVPGATITPATRSPSCSPMTDFVNPNISATATELMFVSVKDYGHPCANKGCLMNFVSRPWAANTQFTQGQQILIIRTASNVGYLQTATTTGTTGAVIPTWPAGIGKETVDGGVTWINQGGTTVVPLAAWAASHAYAAQTRILDSNNNVEVVTTAGTSAAATPIWKTTAGATTTDNTVTWTNAGVWPSYSLTVTGGTGGIIVDNMSPAGGASQIYFFTLGNQLCTTSGGTGLCAMQVSQAALQ